MAREAYEAKIALLVHILPYVAKEDIFALKGGTAINLFYRDLPRLSVDIDLTYIPVKDRTESLAEINEVMDRIATAIEHGIRGAQTQRIKGGGGGATRVLARLRGLTSSHPFALTRFRKRIPFRVTTGRPVVWFLLLAALLHHSLHRRYGRRPALIRSYWFEASSRSRPR
ncbi:nucleotidyl transferase AbiEii/AbiGii toxin family protein [Vreelandella azerica]|uniref:nucleotidyl transferase AbiEii/AbiGii toxin family protein n=1 Tax=Vreelandella azerica TaxID=2732867 RepID=UPI001F1FDAE3|nr:nucleotidyl transferase AbiEii/AbiGii toxin family protein [Halomonas azerica]